MKKTNYPDNSSRNQGHNNINQTQFDTRYDSETEAIWCWMEPAPRPCINTILIEELLLLHQQLTTTYNNAYPETIWPFRHFILASKIPGIYNLGGDLELFKKLIVNRQEKQLRDYAYKCIELLHNNINNLDLPITTVSLVQGQALGGGFEIVLSCDIIIAERSSQMGFPEIIFNLFPGMGAYNLLTRRVGPALAERLILSGKSYSANELFDMGIVNIVAEDGEGEQVVENYLKSQNQSHNTIRAMKRIRQIVHPVTRQDLMDIVDIWVEAAMDLSEKDLAKMDRLLYLQELQKKSENLKKLTFNTVKRHGDWRKIKKVNYPLKTHLGETVTHNRRKNDRRRKE